MESQPDGGESIYRQLSTGEAFIISSQRVKKIYEKMWSETRRIYQLTQNEIDVMLFLKNHGDLDTAADIARYRSMSRSQVCKSVEDLVDSGYLMSIPDQHDRRYLHLKLTDEAGSVLQELQRLREWFWQELQEGISSQEIDIFLHVLERMRSNLKEILPRVESEIKTENERGVEHAEKRIYTKNQRLGTGVSGQRED